MPQTISHSDGDPWYEWTQQTQSILDVARQHRLEQKYFPQGERESFREWLSHVLNGARKVTVLDPFFDNAGAADLFDAVTESRLTLDIVTSITQREGEQQKKQVVPDQHAQLIIRLSGTPETTVHYLGDGKFHDRYLIIENDKRSPARVFSLSNSLNGAMTNYDLFAQELSQFNAEQIMTRATELRGKANTVLSGADFPDLFSRDTGLLKPERPSQDVIDEAVNRLSEYRQDTSGIDPLHFVFDLRTILRAHYYGDISGDHANEVRKHIVQACSCLNSSQISAATDAIVDALEETRDDFERSGRVLLTQPFRVRQFDTLYWLDELHSWGMSSAHLYSMDTGWNSVDLAVFGVLLSTHPDETTKACENREAPHQLVTAGWHAVEMEWFQLTRSVGQPNLNTLRWPVPRLWNAVRGIENAVYSGNSSSFPATAVMEIVNTLPPEEKFVFLGYVDRQLDVLGAGSRNSVNPRFTAEQLAAWEEQSFQQLELAAPTALRSYATARFGEAFERAPEGLTRLVSRFAGEGSWVLVHALHNALSTDTTCALRVMNNLGLSEVEDAADNGKPVAGNQRFSSWLQDAHVFSFSHLANLAVQVLTPEHIDIAVLTRALRSVRTPLQITLGTSCSDDAAIGQRPHAFFLVQLLAYRMLEDREFQLPARIIPTLRILVQYFTSIDRRQHAVARFLFTDALAIILSEEQVDEFLPLLPQDEFRTLLPAAHQSHVSRWIHDVNTILAVPDGEVSWLPLLTGIVYVTLGIRRSSLNGIEPSHISEMDEVIERLIEQEFVQSKDIGLAALEYIRNPGDTEWDRFQENLGRHRTFGVLSASIDGVLGAKT